MFLPPNESSSGFAPFLAARVFAATGATLGRATLAWQLYQMTGSELELGILGLVYFGPTLAFSLVGGAFADAHDRVRIVRASQAAQLLAASVLCLGSLQGWMEVWVLYSLVLITSVAWAFENPAGAALLPGLVHPDAFGRAVTLLSTLRNMGRMTGPVAFGVLAHVYGVAAGYAAQALLMGLSLVCLVAVRPRADILGRRTPGLDSVLEGLRFLRANPAILAAMSLDLVAVIFGGAVALLPVYASDILKVGPRGYGVLAAAIDVGTVGMGVILLFCPPIRSAGRALLWAVAGFGAATIVFGLSDRFALSVAALVAAGMADQVSMVARHLIVQLSTPDALRGRVNSVNQLFIGASNELGAAESGFLAAVTSAPFSVVFGGVVCLAALVASMRVAPALRDYQVASGVESVQASSGRTPASSGAPS